MPSTILSERDTNVPMEQQSQQDGSKPRSMEYHRQVLESRMKEGKSVALTPTAEAPESSSDKASTVAGHTLTKQHAFRNQQTYISPSDTIMSPATQKLAAFKNKHIKAYVLNVQSAHEAVLTRAQDETPVALRKDGFQECRRCCGQRPNVR
jgi:hypothetical protein